MVAPIGRPPTPPTPPGLDAEDGRSTPQPPAGARLVGSPIRPPPAVARAAAQAASEVAEAFGSLLHDLQFSFVVSNARAPDLPIVFASTGFFECTGYSPAEVLGRNCRFLQGSGTSHQSVMEIRDAVREERPCSVCLLNYRKDGTPFWNYFRLEPVRAPCGTVDYFVGLQADVTRLVEGGGGTALAAQAEAGAAAAAAVAARLAAHEAELLAADRTPKCAVLECVPSSMLCALARVQECFVLSDPNQPDCPIVYASPAFLAMTGYSCREVVGRNCRFLQGPGTCPQAVQQLREALAEDRPRAFTTVLLNYRKADAQGRQEPFWNCLHISPLRDAEGKVQYFAGVQMEVKGEEEIDAEAAAAVATGAAAPPAPDAIALLRQKGVVGSLRVATRALAQHGLRRAAPYQHPPVSRDD
ncbi:hypothetical protein ABPG77_007857 [Micractinium sp. CCAP 211/92]